MEDINERAHSSPRSHIQFSSSRSNKLRVSNLKLSGDRVNCALENDKFYGATSDFYDIHQI